jgi:chromosome partitioning protein
MQIFAIVNQKGGVGKTTTAYALVNRLSGKVLAIDLDPQGNLTYSLAIKPSNFENSLRVLQCPSAIKACIKTLNNNLHAIISTPNLSSIQQLQNEVSLYSLRNALENVRDRFDTVVIDTPPNLGILAINALIAANSVIIPTTTDKYSASGMETLLNDIKAIASESRSTIPNRYVLITRYVKRLLNSSRIEREIHKISEKFDATVLNTKIRECAAIRTSQTTGEELPKNSNGEIDYSALAEEISKL